METLRIRGHEGINTHLQRDCFDNPISILCETGGSHQHIEAFVLPLEALGELPDLPGLSQVQDVHVDLLQWHKTLA